MCKILVLYREQDMVFDSLELAFLWGIEEAIKYCDKCQEKRGNMCCGYTLLPELLNQPKGVRKVCPEE